MMRVFTCMAATDSVLCSIHSFIPNGVVLMPRRPAHAGAGRDAGPAGLPDEPVPAPDWMTAEEWEAWCDATAELEDGPPPDLGWDEDPEPDPAGGEPVAWTAGFAEGGLAGRQRCLPLVHCVGLAMSSILDFQAVPASPAGPPPYHKAG